MVRCLGCQIIFGSILDYFLSIFNLFCLTIRRLGTIIYVQFEKKEIVMSQIQSFANNHSTQFARVLAKLIRKHMPYHPQLTTAFNQYNQNMYLHRVLYAYYKSATQHSRHASFMQAYFVRMLRSNPQLLVKAANTPTAHF
jgi:hypothetical protein